MNKICVIINEGENHPTIHQQNNSSGIYPFIKSKEVLKYFNDHFHKSLSLKEGTVCDVICEFDFGYKMCIVRDIETKDIGVMSDDGVIIYNKNRKKMFFNGVFQ